MTDFENKLKEAIERGQRVGDARQEEIQRQRMSQEELKRRHTDFRLKLSERIEQGLKALAHQLPGFDYETVYGERGWGGAALRDELNIHEGKRTNLYSRIEMTVKPFSEMQIVNLVGKGTVRNREVFTRNFYRGIAEADEAEFLDLVDRWILEYAQTYSTDVR